MSVEADRIETLLASFGELARHDLLFRCAEDASLDGRTVRLGERSRLNFGSCSYLGLELDPRLKLGAIDAVQRYGTQFAASRTYCSAPLYAELEARLDAVFGAHCIVTPNTTLAHAAALPVLVADDDAVVLDQYVHQSVRMAADPLRLRGVHVESIRHSRLDELEARVRALRDRHRRVLYLADGVYSMHGDVAPLAALRELLRRYEPLHLYVDDAHGMSWSGRRGRGAALDALADCERVVVATSLNKGFAAGGGALVLPTAELRRRVRWAGAPNIFTGPLQPPSLGAAIASAGIHQSPEIETLQAQLRARVAHFNQLAAAHALPLVGADPTPIRFVGIGLPGAAARVVSRLYERGFWTNIASFPAVAARRSGVRCALTLHHTLEDVQRLVTAIAEELPRALDAGHASLDDVRSHFGLAPSRAVARDQNSVSAATTRPALVVQHEKSIDAIDPQAWDGWLGARGSFSAEGLRVLERSFAEAERPERRWEFDYYVVRDRADRAVLATFFTRTVWKIDIFAPAAVSRVVERRREAEPDYLTSRVMLMGSLLTEGDHLFLDRRGDWCGALTQLLGTAAREADRFGAPMLALRDLPADDTALTTLLHDHGFARSPLPPSLVLELDASGEAAWLSRLSRRARRFLQREVLPFDAAWRTQVVAGAPLSDTELAHLHDLYEAVRCRNPGINTFGLPAELFQHMNESPAFELLQLHACEAPGDAPSAFVACFVGPRHYAPLVIGLDYRHVRTKALYRRSLLECLRRARQLGAERVLLGLGAELEKRRLGAQPLSRALFLRSDDAYPFEVLAQIEAEVSRRSGGPAAATPRPGNAPAADA